MADRLPVSLSPPPNRNEIGIGWVMKNWLQSLFDRVGAGPFMLQGYSKAALPTAADWGKITTPCFTSLIFVYDDVGGPVVAYSNGTSWKRIDTNAVIS